MRLSQLINDLHHILFKNGDLDVVSSKNREYSNIGFMCCSDNFLMHTDGTMGIEIEDNYVHNEEPRKPTNADAIRCMSNEELREFICSCFVCCHYCPFYNKDHDQTKNCNVRSWLDEEYKSDFVIKVSQDGMTNYKGEKL